MRSHRFIILYIFQVYIIIFRLLYKLYCMHHQKSSCHPSLYKCAPLPLSPSPHSPSCPVTTNLFSVSMCLSSTYSYTVLKRNVVHWTVHRYWKSGMAQNRHQENICWMKKEMKEWYKEKGKEWKWVINIYSVSIIFQMLCWMFYIFSVNWILTILQD